MLDRKRLNDSLDKQLQKSAAAAAPSSSNSWFVFGIYGLFIFSLRSNFINLKMINDLRLNVGFSLLGCRLYVSFAFYVQIRCLLHMGSYTNVLSSVHVDIAL